MKQRQQGIALITVLFTVALLTILVAQLQAQLQIDIERTTWLQRDIQAREYALGAEQLARQILWKERQELLLAGVYRSPCPGPELRYQPPHGEIRLRIVDLQGRVNFNNVAQEDGLSALPDRYLRDALGMPEIEPLIEDWIDGDSTPLPAGAEDTTYEVSRMPFRTPNRPMVDPSEIIVPGNLEYGEFIRHASLLTTLPVPTPLNINTMSEQLITLIHPDLSPAQFRHERDMRGGFFDDLNDFLQSNTTAGVDIDPQLVTVNSAYFAIHVSARVDGHWRHLVSRVKQNPRTGRIELIDRSTPLPIPLIADKTGNDHDTKPDSVF